MVAQQAKPAPVRLLLPAALGIAAGIGLALAFADDAHAADRDPHALVDVAARAVSTVTGHTGRDRAAGKATPPAAPRAVDKTVRRTTGAVSQVTDTVDQVTAPLPGVGRAVDTATDLTGQIVTRDRPQRPESGGLADTVGRLLTGGRTTPPPGPAATPQTAPEPARGQPPLLIVDSGAQFPTATATPRRPAPHGAAPAARHSGHQATPDRSQSTPHSWGTHRRANVTTTPSTDSKPCTPAGRWPHVPQWQHHITTYIADRDGRTDSPLPPSG